MGDDGATAAVAGFLGVNPAGSAASPTSSAVASASRERKGSNRQRWLPRPPPPPADPSPGPDPAAPTPIAPDDGTEVDDPAVLLARDDAGVLEGDDGAKRDVARACWSGVTVSVDGAVTVRVGLAPSGGRWWWVWAVALDEDEALGCGWDGVASATCTCEA